MDRISRPIAGINQACGAADQECVGGKQPNDLVKSACLQANAAEASRLDGDAIAAEETLKATKPSRTKQLVQFASILIPIKRAATPASPSVQLPADKLSLAHSGDAACQPRALPSDNATARELRSNASNQFEPNKDAWHQIGEKASKAIDQPEHAWHQTGVQPEDGSVIVLASNRTLPGMRNETSAPMDSMQASSQFTSMQASVQLDGRIVACQAACCAPLPKLLEQRATTILSQLSGHASEQAEQTAKLQARFLRHTANSQRDQIAANALRGYYGWIAGEEQLRIVRSGYELQRDQLATQEALIQRGVAIEDPTALERIRLELRDKEIQLTNTQRQLADGLMRGTCCAVDIRSAAVESLEIRATQCNCHALMTYALANRQDYIALTELCECLNRETARGVGELLTPIASGVGAQLFDRSLLNLGLIEKICLGNSADELENALRRELQMAIQHQRTRIEQAVCEKCQALGAAYERVDVAVELAATWDKRIAALQRLGELGDARGEALAKARSERLTAQSAIITRKLEAKNAEIDLAEAVGGLTGRCCRGEPWLVCIPNAP